MIESEVGFVVLIKVSIISPFSFKLNEFPVSNNLSELFLDEIIRLNLRVELLTKRNTRDKLLSYFDILSKSSMRKTFTLPYNYTDLADFLSVDRSAMMRELKLLIDEGFVEKNGSKITLLY